jgi:hypothetical protein
VLVISYYDYDNPRIFRDVECGYGDVELHDADDIVKHLAVRECIHVLRSLDSNEASHLYKALEGKRGQLRRDALFEEVPRIWDFMEKCAEEGSEYQQQTIEEYVTMAKPEPKGGPKPAEAKADKKPREKKSQFAADQKITMGVDKEGKKYGSGHNPKRGKAAERFAKYKDGMTVKQALDAGLTSGDLNWDTARKLISIS